MSRGIFRQPQFSNPYSPRARKRAWHQPFAPNMLRGCTGLGCLGLDNSEVVRYGVPGVAGVVGAYLLNKSPVLGGIAGLVLAHLDPGGYVSSLTASVVGMASSMGLSLSPMSSALVVSPERVAAEVVEEREPQSSDEALLLRELHEQEKAEASVSGLGAFIPRPRVSRRVARSMVL